MSYPDHPDHVIGSNDRIFSDQCPVAGYQYLKGVDARRKEYLIEWRRTTGENQCFPVSKDKFHVLRDSASAGCLNILFRDVHSR